MRFSKTKILLLLISGAVLYLCLWPVSIRPQAWEAPAPPPETGVLAPNNRLASVSRIGPDALNGPEAVAFDSAGRLYTGLLDGRIVRIDGKDCTVIANTDGRPLGLSVLPDGNIVVADAVVGLLQVSADGAVDELARLADGIRLNFADDLTVDSTGKIYFTDASWKFGIDRPVEEALEHAANGRMLRYDPDSGNAYTLLADLYFANGIALGPNEDYVLINETTAYRVTRFWLRGEKAGQREVFAQNLPGLPDNITFNGRDRFWVALFSTRLDLLDALAPHPFLRKMLARLPSALHPGPSGPSMIVGLDLEGRIVESYQGRDADAYRPITSVREHQGDLYLGSLSDGGIARVPLSVLRDGTSSSLDDIDISCD